MVRGFGVCACASGAMATGFWGPQAVGFLLVGPKFRMNREKDHLDELGQALKSERERMAKVREEFEQQQQELMAARQEFLREKRGWENATALAQRDAGAAKQQVLQAKEVCLSRALRPMHLKAPCPHLPSPSPSSLYPQALSAFPPPSLCTQSYAPKSRPCGQLIASSVGLGFTSSFSIGLHGIR